MRDKSSLQIYCMRLPLLNSLTTSYIVTSDFPSLSSSCNAIDCHAFLRYEIRIAELDACCNAKFGRETHAIAHCSYQSVRYLGSSVLPTLYCRHFKLSVGYIKIMVMRPLHIDFFVHCPHEYKVSVGGHSLIIAPNCLHVVDCVIISAAGDPQRACC